MFISDSVLPYNYSVLPYNYDDRQPIQILPIKLHDAHVYDANAPSCPRVERQVAVLNFL